MKADAELFFEACEDFNAAVDLLNGIKEDIKRFDGSTARGMQSIRYNLNECKDTPLSQRINNALLFLQRESEFNEQYQQLLTDKMDYFNTVDLSSLTKEEQAEYNIVVNQQQRLLLEQLEKYDKEGLLTEDGKKMLQQQRLVVANMDAQSEMAGLRNTDSRYIELYQQMVENNKGLIQLNSNLTDEQKQSEIESLEKNSSYTVDILQMSQELIDKQKELKKLKPGTAEYYNKENELLNLQNKLYDRQIEFLNTDPANVETVDKLKEAKNTNNDYIQLNNYQISGDTNKAMEKKVEMGIATQQEIDTVEYNNMSWLEQRWEDAKAIPATAYTTLAGVGESLIDGSVMLFVGPGGILSDGTATWVEEFVSPNYSEMAYNSFIEDGTLNYVAAYSFAHDATQFLTNTGAYVGLSCIPGIGGNAVMAIAGAGSSAQTAFDSGASFKEALATSYVNAALAFASDKALDKVNASSLSSLGKTGLRTLIGMGEPALNMISEYGIYGYENSDGLLDYGVTSGGFLNIAIGGTVANASSLIGKILEPKIAAKLERNALDLINSSTHKQLANAIKGLDDASLYFVIKNLDSSGIKNLVNNSFGESLSRILNKMDEVQLKNLAGMVDVKTCVEVVSNLDVAKVGTFIDSMSNTKLSQLLDMSDLSTKGLQIKSKLFAVDNSVKLDTNAKMKLLSEITNLEDLKTVGTKLLGYSEEAMDMYQFILADDSDWSSIENFRKNIINGEYSDQALSKLGIDVLDFKNLEAWEQRDVLKLAHGSFKANELTNLQYLDLNTKVSATAQTLFATQVMSANGVYDISADDVIKARMEARLYWNTGGEFGQLVPSKKIMIDGTDYSDCFPKCDKFISNEALRKYTIEIANLDELKLVEFADTLGVSYDENKFEVLAKWLKKNVDSVNVNGKVFQNASPGAANFVTFKQNLGDVRQVSGDYNVTGGAYMLFSDDATIAQKYSYCCTLDEHGKLVVTDIKKFGEDVLSGVPLGVDGAYMFDCAIPLNSTSMPSINNSSMYTAYGVPGGKLLSGETEIVITGTNLTGKMNTSVDSGYMGEYDGSMHGDGKHIVGYKIKEGKE